MQLQALRTAGIALIVGGLAACGDAGPGDVENIDIQMQRTDQMVMHVTAGWFASVAGTAGSAVVISPDTVASLIIRVTDIEFLPAEQEGNEEDDGAWIRLALPDTVELDLMTLPTEGESPVVIASGAVPEGDYSNVRLFVDGATIEFNGPISLGAAFTFDGGVAHDVTIPSGAETGLKTDASFSVTADAQGNVNDVNLLFSTGSTFQNVNGTGTGEVILAPVIRGNSAQGE